MPTDEQIALMCDIGQSVVKGKTHDLQQLVADGYVEESPSEPSGYKLTGKAQQFLSERGAGLNEA